MWELQPHKNNVGTQKGSPGKFFPEIIVLNTTIMTNRSLKRGKRLVYLGIACVNTTSKNLPVLLQSHLFEILQFVEPSGSSRGYLLRLLQTSI